MRTALTVTLTVLLCGPAMSSDTRADDDGPAIGTLGELRVEIHSPAPELVLQDGETEIEVEGMASTIGGVRFIDLMLVMDTSQSLHQTDPNDFRSAGAIGLIESLSSKSNTQIAT